jgi:hypothetical protein
MTLSSCFRDTVMHARQRYNVPVLPGPEQVGPPFQQKYTAILQKLTANSYF